MKKINFMVIVLLMVLTFQLSGLVVMNDIVPVFSAEKQGEIEEAVIRGAVHFLEAQSRAALFLKEIEKSSNASLDYEAALAALESTRLEVEAAVADYSEATSTATGAGYRVSVLDKFKAFNYDSHTAQNQLDSDMMTTVKAYFSGGNIVGAYQQNLAHLADILVTLQQMKDRLAAGQSPDLSNAWLLLRHFARAAMFGNYCTATAAVVFKQ